MYNIQKELVMEFIPNTNPKIWILGIVVSFNPNINLIVNGGRIKSLFHIAQLNGYELFCMRKLLP